MCLAVPGRIEDFTCEEPFKMALVDFCGVKREVCLDTVDDAKVGDYVVAHAGVAISVMDEATAQETINDLEEMARYRDEQLSSPSELWLP